MTTANASDAVTTTGSLAPATATINPLYASPEQLEEDPTSKAKFHDKRSANYVIRSAVAGGVAGCVAKTVIAPLDRVKILFQASSPDFRKYAGTWMGVFRASKQIYEANGYRGLFQGHSATLLRIFPYAAIKFVAYEQFHHLLVPSGVTQTSYRQFLAGSLAGVTSVLCTYPLELIRVRLAFEMRNDRSMGFKYTCRTIYHESAASHQRLVYFPIMSFYRGIFPTIIGIIPYAGVSFVTHHMLTEFCHSKLSKFTTNPSLARGKLDSRGRERRPPLKTWAELLVGGMAGAISQTAAYPLEVTRRRMQVYGALDPSKFVGVRDTIRTIWRQSGFNGFFVGLSIGYLKVTPMVAVSFTVYDRMKLFLNIE